MASATEGLKFNFSNFFHLILLNLNSHMWLVLDSTALDQGVSGIEQVDVK